MMMMMIHLEFASYTGSSALVAKVSRLVIDVNRPTDSPTLIRDVADGKPISLNTGTLSLTQR